MAASNGSHFLLFTEAGLDGDIGTWRFVLSEVGVGDVLTAADAEPTTYRERIELLAVVRGLEALDRPARVTLVTNSRYVSRGLKHGLADWRAADWQWERFGQLVPVRDRDLWRRVDRALEFHKLDCRFWHFDAQIDESPQVDDASTNPAEFAYPVKNLRRRAPRSVAYQPAGLAAG